MNQDNETLRDALAFIRAMANAYAEKRSDVADLCTAFLEYGAPFNPYWVEHRYVQATTAVGTRIEYDTLTTEISELLDEKNSPYDPDWRTCDDHDYKDDPPDDPTPGQKEVTCTEHQ